MTGKKTLCNRKTKKTDGNRSKSLLSLAVILRNITNEAVTFVSPDSKSMHLCFDVLKTDSNDLPDVPSSPEHSLDSDAMINNFISGKGYTNILQT